MENISSEQDLKELFEEGKITEEEYEQLLDAMQKKPQPTIQQIDSAPVKNKPRHRIGILAFACMLLGLFLPVSLIFPGIGLPIESIIITLLLVFLCELFALILGAIAFSFHRISPGFSIYSGIVKNSPCRGRAVRVFVRGPRNPKARLCARIAVAPCGSEGRVLRCPPFGSHFAVSPHPRRKAPRWPASESL